MPENRERFEYLLERYLNETFSWEEMQELFDYIGKEENKDFLFAFMEAKDKNLPFHEDVNEVDWAHMYQNIMERPSPGRTLMWKRLTAAAAILLVALGTYFMAGRFSFTKPPARTAVLHKVVPGGNKAILILADGSQIVLDHAKNGVLASQKNSAITKTRDGQLLYDASGSSAEDGKTAYNTVSIPKGGQYQVILPDGTKVWLNAASQLKFPTSFAGNERNVELVGEAYFEVAKVKVSAGKTQQHMPFIVSSKGQRVEVLGTHFNVMAYDDEPVWKTSLLEGKVSVSRGAQSSILTRGQQARVSKTGSIEVLSCSPEEAVAWKNGYFHFSRTDLQSIMRQIARWYDIDIVYEGEIPNDEYVGEISRSADLSEVLRVLELSHLHFRMENRKLMVRQ